MTIAIMATGDEIVHGDTLNTNSNAIAHALTSEGLPPGLHLSCSDNEQEMLSCLTFLCQKHDIVILIGGLGPTSDDLTRFALARFLKVSLIEFPEAVMHIKARLARANLNFNSGNRQQALFPTGATLLPNPHGTAMGCCYRSQGKLFILLPGPPRECLPMFNEHVLPVLQKIQHTDKHLLKWRLFGVAEGAIAEVLDSALSTVNCEIGYRLETPYVEFKVRCVKEEEEKIKQIVEPLIHTYIIASPKQKASERLREKIEQMQRPVVVIDDATGGVLQTLLQRPSTHPWLNFHDIGDSNTLFFHVSGLKEYWEQQSGSITDITIKYHNDIEHGSETHQMPYRSPLVIEYAAEWLSFRLFHLIDQLHQ
jgi:nicotinamide-nucleotide amidase